MIKKKCKECGTLLNPYAPEYCDVCHGNYGWWFTCDKHEDIIFREELEECPVCKAEKGVRKETGFVTEEVSSKSPSTDYGKRQQGKTGQNDPPEIQEEIKGNKPNGLGGWLILVGFGIILNTLMIGFFLLTVYLPLLFNGLLVELFDNGSDVYNPSLGLFVGFELVIMIGLLLFSLIILVKYFTRNHLLKKYFIVFHLSTCSSTASL